MTALVSSFQSQEPAMLVAGFFFSGLPKELPLQCVIDEWRGWPVFDEGDSCDF
jgi:hypothetical protein